VKVFVLAPREDWICDRLVSEWYENFPNESTRNMQEADVIWLLAGWCWNHIPQNMLKTKKVVVTEHHIVPEKYTQQKYHNFLIRDQFVDCYHVPNEKTASLLSQLTKKNIVTIPYWLNDKLWYTEDKQKAREYLGLDTGMFYVGSFQRDTEGSDLITPKLEKGPDLFCDYLVRNKDKFNNLHVLLGGWRRQYVQKRLEGANIPYTLFNKTSIEKIRSLYNALDLYIVSSRYEGGPQAVIEASNMRVPIISTDVGIASDVLSKNCIIDIENDFYIPEEADIEINFQNVSKLTLLEHGKRFIELFSGLK